MIDLARSHRLGHQAKAVAGARALAVLNDVTKVFFKKKL